MSLDDLLWFVVIYLNMIIKVIQSSEELILFVYLLYLYYYTAGIFYNATWYIWTFKKIK